MVHIIFWSPIGIIDHVRERVKFRSTFIVDEACSSRDLMMSLCDPPSWRTSILHSFEPHGPYARACVVVIVRWHLSQFPQGEVNLGDSPNEVVRSLNRLKKPGKMTHVGEFRSAHRQ